MAILQERDQMPPILWLAVLGGLLALMIVAIFALLVAGRRIPEAKLSDKNRNLTRDARYEGTERPASLVSEQIEEMVKQRLAEHTDLTDVEMDFGTMPDGTIDIWVNGEQFDDVEDIPDDRIREAIKAAVEEFNRRADD
jgi:hypothetical protein